MINTSRLSKYDIGRHLTNTMLPELSATLLGFDATHLNLEDQDGRHQIADPSHWCFADGLGYRFETRLEKLVPGIYWSYN